MRRKHHNHQRYSRYRKSFYINDLRLSLAGFYGLALALPNSLVKRFTVPTPWHSVRSALATKAQPMGLELLSMTVFWTWNAFQPALQPAPVAMVVPTKVILQASWVEPVSLRDETSPPAQAQPAAKKRQWPTSQRAPLATVRKPQKPLWQAAKSWEIPPILWAGFEGFLAAGLGIVSLLKR